MEGEAGEKGKRKKDCAAQGTIHPGRQRAAAELQATEGEGFKVEVVVPQPKLRGEKTPAICERHQCAWDSVLQ